MAHVAIQEADDNGQVVTWLDHVTDEEYSGRSWGSPARPMGNEASMRRALYGSVNTYWVRGVGSFPAQRH